MQLKKIKQSISEKQIETYLCKKIKALGGEAYKFVSPARRAVPDRLCIIPSGVSIFVEVKRPGQRPTQLQLHELDKLVSYGQLACFVSSYADVDGLVSTIKHLLERKAV